MDIICPKCDHFIAKNNGSPDIMWLLKDHIENDCTPEKPYEPSVVTQCCGSKHWDSDEDGYRCSECGTMSMKRKFFLKKNPNHWEVICGKFTVNDVTYGEEE
jgi:hypothetical protein